LPVLEAAHREAVQLIVRVTVDSSLGQVQVPSPGISPRLKRGPEVRVAAQIVERAVSVAVASQN